MKVEFLAPYDEKTMARIYHDDAADLGLIQNRRVAVIGYGSYAERDSWVGTKQLPDAYM
jgi:hypothetical protein